jgi:hypothetical protein
VIWLVASAGLSAAGALPGVAVLLNPTVSKSTIWHYDPYARIGWLHHHDSTWFAHSVDLSADPPAYELTRSADDGGVFWQPSPIVDKELPFNFRSRQSITFINKSVEAMERAHHNSWTMWCIGAPFPWAFVRSNDRFVMERHFASFVQFENAVLANSEFSFVALLKCLAFWLFFLSLLFITKKLLGLLLLSS